METPQDTPAEPSANMAEPPDPARQPAKASTAPPAGGRDARQVADAVAYVCQRLDYLRDKLTRTGEDRSAPLRDLLHALEAAQDLAGPLEALHNALRRAGHSPGVWGPERGLNPPGLSNTPMELRYPCPTGRCSGRRPTQGTIFPMRCAITGEELIRERL